MSHGTEWFLAVVSIVLVVGLMELRPQWGGMMLLVVVLVMVARGIRSGEISAPKF